MGEVLVGWEVRGGKECGYRAVWLGAWEACLLCVSGDLSPSSVANAPASPRGEAFMRTFFRTTQ